MAEQAAVRGTWRGVAAAVCGVAAMTAALASSGVRGQVANVSMLYLLVVLFVAWRWGRWPAGLASLLSFLCFDWFFIEPRHRLTVADPAEWLALLMFLATTMVVSHLTAQLQAQVAAAERRERETAALAAASLAVASQVDRDHALTAVLGQLIQAAGAAAAAVVMPGSGEALQVVAAHASEGQSLPDFNHDPARQAVTMVLEQGQPIGWTGTPQFWAKALGDTAAGGAYLPLRTEGRVLGVLFVRLPAGLSEPEPRRRVVEALAHQAGVVLDRDRLLQAELTTQALAEADRLKTALLSMVSHDFRSPLASIKAGATSLLQDAAPVDPATAGELLRGIDGEVDRLNAMVENILALSRLQAGAWRPQCEWTSLTETVGAALASLSPAGGDRVKVSLPADLDEVWLDPVQGVEVLRNLLENALKYSGAAQPVELSLRREGSDLIWEVRDRGEGLPAGEEQRVFEPFYRAPQWRESSLSGVGLGLAVCRGLVEAHEGTITARRRGGGGTVFRVVWPQQEPA